MKAKRTILFFLILSVLIPIPLVRPDPGWLTGWKKRVKITIDSGDVDTALTDFPVLIYLGNSSGINGEDVTFIFDEVGANSLKMAVTLSDGTTECYVEVEKWDFGSEAAWIWAKIQSISNITDTEIYLYYDNDHADNVNFVGLTNSIPAENVWDGDFAAVFHMADGVDNAHVYDSTGNSRDGIKGAADNPLQTILGKIGNAQDFNTDYMVFPAFNLNDYTIEAWVYPDVVNIIEVIISNDPPNNPQVYLRITDANNLYWQSTDDEADHLFGTEAHGIGADIWHYWSLQVIDTIGTIDIDLVEKGIDDNVNYGSQTFGTVYNIGRDPRGINYWDGCLDEIRVSTIFRTEAWIKATYETDIDDLLDFGSEQTELEEPNKLFGAGFNASAPYVVLRWASNLTDIDFFEIQNSTDKISWDYLGQSMTKQYTDLQVTNGLERFYRVRACNFTEGAWINSTFTDINFEKVYFVMGGGGLFPGLAIGISLIIIAVMYFWETRR